MKKRPWLYLYNPFLSSRISDIVLYQIAEHLYNVLTNEQSDLEIKGWLVLLDPVFGKYKTAFNQFHSGKGISMGETQRYNELMDMLPTKVHQWMHDVEDKFLNTTPDFKAIFAGGRTSFNEGKLVNRHNRVAELELALENYPALDAVKQSVKDFRLQLDENKTTKAGKFDDVSKLSDLIDELHVELAEVMYCILGKAISYYYKKPAEVERFFKQSLLRTKSKKANYESDAYILYVDMAGSAVADFELKAGKTYVFKNNGNQSVFYAGIANISDVPAATALSELTAGDEAEITAEALGYPQNRMVYFQNKSTTEEAEVEIAEI